MDVLQNRLGYVVDSKVMNPCEYANVPQNRERIFVVGFDPKQVKIPKKSIPNGSLLFDFPQKIELKRSIHDIIDDSFADDKFFYDKNHIY